MKKIIMLLCAIVLLGGGFSPVYALGKASQKGLSKKVYTYVSQGWQRGKPFISKHKKIIGGVLGASVLGGAAFTAQFFAQKIVKNITLAYKRYDINLNEIKKTDYTTYKKLLELGIVCMNAHHLNYSYEKTEKTMQKIYNEEQSLFQKYDTLYSALEGIVRWGGPAPQL